MHLTVQIWSYDVKVVKENLFWKIYHNLREQAPLNHLRRDGRSADLKINKSAPLSLNHCTFSNTEPFTQNKV